MTNETNIKAATILTTALLESMRKVKEALEKSTGVPPEQLIDKIEEWEQLVTNLAGSPRDVELATLYETIRILNSSLDLTETLSAVLDALIDITGAERSCLMLLDENEKLEIQAACHFDREDTDTFDLELSHTVIQHVVESGEPVLTTNAQLDPRFSDQESVVGYHLRSIICVPLYVRDHVIGALYLDNRMRDGVFSKADLPLLSAFASQAAVALENARLHEELQRQADELRATVVKLQELDRLKSEFIQNVSHELRTPLAIIQGYATLLDNGELGELQPDQQRSVSIIQRRTQILNDIVEDITFLLEAEAKPLEPEPVLLSEIVRTALENFEIAIEQAGLRLYADVSPNLSPISGSPVYLQRVVENLLDNAIKFTPTGGKINVTLWQEGDQAFLQIADTGIGIPSDQQWRIFDRFYQVNGSAQRRYGGMGLGLAVVREIIEAHAGTINVESEVGKGSTFTVALPCERPSPR